VSNVSAAAKVDLNKLLVTKKTEERKRGKKGSIIKENLSGVPKFPTKSSESHLKLNPKEPR